MDIDDAALMFKGWGDDLITNERLARKITVNICDTVNRTFGGKGAWRSVMSGWKLPGDAPDLITDVKKLAQLKKFKDLDLKNGSRGWRDRKKTTDIIDLPPVHRKKKQNGKR